MVTIKWLFSGTLDWIRLTCEWTIRLQSSSPLPYEFVIQGYNIVFFTLALDERRWKRVAGSSIFVSSSWSFFPVSLYQLFTVDQHTCWVLRGGALLRPDCRCDQSCLSAPPLALVGVTMLHLVRETLRGGGVSCGGDVLLLLSCVTFSLFVSIFPHFCHKQNSMKSVMIM